MKEGDWGGGESHMYKQIVQDINEKELGLSQLNLQTLKTIPFLVLQLGTTDFHHEWDPALT